MADIDQLTCVAGFFSAFDEFLAQKRGGAIAVRASHQDCDFHFRILLFYYTGKKTPSIVLIEKLGRG
jgi:hypothetical protein